MIDVYFVWKPGPGMSEKVSSGGAIRCDLPALPAARDLVTFEDPAYGWFFLRVTDLPRVIGPSGTMVFAEGLTAEEFAQARDSLGSSQLDNAIGCSR